MDRDTVQTARDPFGDETNRQADLGVGKPFETLDRRDLTIKPRRQAPTPPNSTPPTTAIPLPSSASSLPTSRRPTHRYTHSTPQFTIPTPNYVRSQPLGLSRNKSMTAGAGEHSPTVSGGLIRRGSLSASESEDEGEGRGRARSESLPRFPPSHEGEGDMESEEQRRKERLQKEVDALPPHPRLWLPSHLSLYITHSLSLHPRLAEDITHFITTSRLGGRTFLRLREREMEELGMSTPWMEAMMKAQKELRERAAFGVMWGYEGGSALSSAPMSPELGAIKPELRRRGSVEVEGSDMEEELGKEEWKKSWRALQGSSSRGRVRGIAHAFEKVEEGSREGTPDCSPIKVMRRSGGPGGGSRVTIDAAAAEREGKRISRVGIFPQSPYPPFRGGAGGHGRSDSTSSSTSTASIDSGSGADSLRSTEDDTGEYRTPQSFSSRSLAAQLAGIENQQDSATSTPQLDFDPDHGASPPPSSFLPTPAPTPSYQSNISAHSRPYGLVRRPSERRADSVLLLHRDQAEEEEREERTVKAASEGSGVVEKGRTGLGELFGFQLPSTSSAGGGARELDEVVEMEVGARGGKKGSMVMVKRSQLAALSKRMAEVETQVALAQGVGSVAPSEVGDSELEELERRLQGIESLLPLSSPTSPARSTRSNSQLSTTNSQDLALAPRLPTHSQILSTWVTNSLTNLSLSDMATSSHDSARQLAAPSGPLMSWTALGGYCICATVGIGLVAGEVVVARLFGIRRR